VRCASIHVARTVRTARPAAAEQPTVEQRDGSLEEDQEAARVHRVMIGGAVPSATLAR